MWKYIGTQTAHKDERKDSRSKHISSFLTPREVCLWPSLDILTTRSDNPAACEVTGEKDCDLVEFALTTSWNGGLVVCWVVLMMWMPFSEPSQSYLIGGSMAWNNLVNLESIAPSLQVNPAAISKTQIDRENKHFDNKTPQKKTWLLLDY